MHEDCIRFPVQSQKAHSPRAVCNKVRVLELVTPAATDIYNYSIVMVAGYIAYTVNNRTCHLVNMLK